MLALRRCAYSLAVCLVFLLGFNVPLHGQSTVAATAAVSPSAPCCGVITPEGQRLKALLDSLDVEHHWLANERVSWKTGAATHNGDFVPHDTHCSAFAAAVSMHLNVYLLRPPEHKTSLLASAQGRWR